MRSLTSWPHHLQLEGADNKSFASWDFQIPHEKFYFWIRIWVFELQLEDMIWFADWKNRKNGQNGQNGQSRLYPVFFKSSTWAKTYLLPRNLFKIVVTRRVPIILLQIFFGSVVGTPELILSLVMYFIFISSGYFIQFNTRRRQL